MCECESNPAEVYERYLGRAIADPFTRVLLECAGPKQGDRVLDLAAGTGSVARHVAPVVGVEGRVVAVDINSAMLAVGRAVLAPDGAPIEWREGNAVNLDLPDRAFDLVLCQQGLQFFSDRTAALRETRRVLTKDGRAAFSVWQQLDLHPVYKGLFEAMARHLGAMVSDFGVSFSLGDADELEGLFRKTGFQRIEVTPRALEIRLSSPERFVQLTVAGAATSVPTFIRMSPGTRTKVVEAIAEELEPLISSYNTNGEFLFTMSTNLALAA